MSDRLKDKIIGFEHTDGGDYRPNSEYGHLEHGKAKNGGNDIGDVQGREKIDQAPEKCRTISDEHESGCNLSFSLDQKRGDEGHDKDIVL